jgi:hypothetical protein
LRNRSAYDRNRQFTEAPRQSLCREDLIEGSTGTLDDLDRLFELGGTARDDDLFGCHVELVDRFPHRKVVRARPVPSGQTL